MNIQEIKSYKEQTVDIVVSVINKAMEVLGVRQTLKELAIPDKVSRYCAETRAFAHKAKIPLDPIVPPLALTCEDFIVDIIERKWKLTAALLYVLEYRGGSKDETAQFYYYEAIFSQPTVAYPIPQATVSVFFRLQDKHIEPSETLGVPKLTFRIEGHHSDHDVRYVKLTIDWILAVIQMKIKLFKRIEELRLF